MNVINKLKIDRKSQRMKTRIMNYAYAVSNKGVKWKVIFMVLTLIFTVVKGTLQWSEKAIVYGDFVSCTKTKRIRKWQIFFEKEGAWKRQRSGLKICREET